MLRKVNQDNSCLPRIAVAPWVSHTPRKVKVKVMSDDKKTLIREEEQIVVDSEIVTPASQVRKDTAELYSIENMQEAGISPVFLSQPYLCPSFDSLHVSQVEGMIDSELKYVEQPASSSEGSSEGSAADKTE